MGMKVANTAPGNELNMMVRFITSPRQASRARMAAFDVVTVGWDLDNLADDTELITSELVSNALRKSKLPPILTVTCDGNSVIVAVWDDSPEIPALKDPGDLDVHGRGLHIVAVLSKEYGCYANESGGKVVWARLAI